MMPALLTGDSEEVANKKASELLYAVGLQKKIHMQVKNLSGGERQRVAVARALVHEPQVVLADEPTANLDQASNQLVTNLIFDLTRANQASLLFVTHDERIAKKANIIKRMGRTEYELKINYENSL
jgi:ABC-type lipoprotein export system ATPase subunit